MLSVSFPSLILMFKILQWNIRSITSNKDNLQYNIEEYHPNIILLSETWLKIDQTFKIPGYNIIRQDRSTRGGGIASLIKDNLLFTDHVLSLSPPDGVNIHAFKVDHLSIVNIYCPPNIVLPLDFWHNLTSALISPYLICGDINAQNPSWGSHNRNRNGNILEQFLLSSDSCLLNDGSSTRVTPPDKSSSPDICLCSPDIRIDASWEVLPDPGGSDHYPTLTTIMDLNLPELPQNFFSTSKYNIKKANWLLFQELIIHEIERQDIQGLDDIQAIILSAADRSIPVKKHPEKLSSYRVPWWDDELTTHVKNRSDAYKKYRLNPTLENYLNAKHKQATTKRKIREKKKTSFREFCESLSVKDSKNLWRNIRRFRSGVSPSPSRRASPSCGREILSRLCPSPQLDLNEEDRTPLRNIDPPPGNHSMLFSPFTLCEMSKTIHRKKDSAPGKDAITYSMLKHLPIQAKNVLLQVYNRLFTDPNIPPSLKETIIVPICKPGKPPHDPNSYRPIALTSCLLKIFETLMASRLERVYELNVPSNEPQYGFRKGKSVTDALTAITVPIYSAYAMNEITLVVFLDVKQAYDSVNFDILKSVLMAEGVPLQIINLLRNLIVDRSIFLLDPCLNELIGPVSSFLGLAQGSPDSCPLFNLFVKGLSSFLNIPGVEVLQYADDTTVKASGKTFKEAFENMSRALAQVEEWTRSRGLTISAEKSQAMCFHKRKILVNLPTLYIFDNAIPWKTSTKYLGVTLQVNMNWSLHIENMCSRATRNINVMKSLCRTWWGSHPQTMLTIYNAIVLPFLDYGSVFLGRCSKSVLSRLDRVQYSAIRVALGYMKSTPINVLLAESGQLPLSYRRIWLAIKFLSKLAKISPNPLLQRLSQLFSWRHAWGSRPMPPILEALNMLPETGSFYSSPLLPCFQVPLCVHYLDVPYYSLNLRKLDLDNSGLFDERCRDKFPDFSLLFTDASKSRDQVGIGIYSPGNISFSGRVPSSFSISSAELLAIDKALSIIEGMTDDVLIISDSKSALEKLKGWFPHSSNDHITLSIRNKIYRITQTNRQIKFVWVPSHTNITGNDQADRLAKEGSKMSHTLTIKGDIKEHWPSFKRNIWERWKTEWKQTSLHRGHLYSTMINVDHFSRKPWFHSFADLPRGNITTMNRLRANHCCSPAHLAKIQVRDDDLCECGERGDLQHIFFSCSLNDVKCRNLYDDLCKIYADHNFPLNIQDLIFSENVLIYRSLYGFLNSCGLKL